MKVNLQSEGLFKIVVFVGVVCTLASVIGGWGGFEFAVNYGIQKLMRLVPGSLLWETWKTIPMPVYIKFNLFNITNPDEFSGGAKARLTEMGPYVYLVDFDKFDFDKNETIDTILYSPTRTYYFQPDLSRGNEYDLVTYVNVMFVAVSHTGNNFTSTDVDKMLANKGEKLTRTDRVKDLLFDGVSIQAYVDLANDQTATLIDIPEKYQDGRFALFKGKNGTKDGRWECHSGDRNYAEIGKLHSYNGNTKLNLYSADNCNALNGTDGFISPPFVIPGKTDLYIFIPELCRSIRWEFVKMVDVGRVTVARHRFPDIKTVNEDPELGCFCLKDNPLECDDIHGIVNLAHCFGGVPLFYSKPHFLHADSSIRNHVDGIRPNPFAHESQLDIHPLTGVAVTASIKMQFSIELVPWKSMSSFKNASHSIIPFIWIELLVTLTGFNLFMIRLLSLTLWLLPIWRWLAFLGSVGIIFLGLFFGYRCRKQNIK